MSEENLNVSDAGNQAKIKKQNNTSKKSSKKSDQISNLFKNDEVNKSNSQGAIYNNNNPNSNELNKETEENENNNNNNPTNEENQIKKEEKKISEEEQKLIDELNSLKNQLENEKKIHEKEQKKLQNQIKTKESSINLIQESNRNLESSLSTLQKKYEKLYYKNIANESQKKNSNQNSALNESDIPIEIALKVKERELKNNENIILTLSKENKQLTRLIDNYQKDKENKDISDLILIKEKENKSIENEIKTMKLLTKEHKNCEIEKKNLIEIIVSLKEELKQSKINLMKNKKNLQNSQSKYLATENKKKKFK